MKYYLLTILSFTLFFTHCSKERHDFLLPPTGHSFTDSAFNYLHTNLSPAELNELSTLHYQLITHRNNNRFVLMHYKNKRQSLLLEKTSEGFSGHVIQFNYTNDEHTTGSLTTEDLLTHNGHQINFYQGKVISTHPTTEGQINTYAVNHSAITPAVAIVPLKSDDVIVIYVYTGGGGNSHGVNLSSLYYMTDFNGQYYYSYIPSPQTHSSGFGSGGGAGSSASAPSITSVVDLPIVPAADKPINITQELKCFEVVSGATYTLRIKINQPEPNTRDIINTTAERKVGHTYLTLEQKNPNGTVIIRNVGLYPKEVTKPADGSVPATFQDDTQTPYSVSMTISVSPSEFMNVKNYLQSVKQYELQNTNCTTIGINAFAKANVNLPKTIGVINSPNNDYAGMISGKFPLFKGVNPSDLGEDIRGLNATQFARNNGNRSVIIERRNGNEKTSTRMGSCN